jgi:Holliday junction resolvase RusA-like endonuclease
MIKLHIPLAPKAKGRPRFSKLINRVHSPEKTVVFENSFRAALLSEFGFPLNRYPLFEKEIPLHVQIDFVFDRTSSKLQQAILSKSADKKTRAWRPYGPDLDNLAKAVLDASNEIIWFDDRQIVSLQLKKFIAARKESACINIEISPVLPLVEIPDQVIDEAL